MTGVNLNKIISVPQLIVLMVINRIVISMTFGSYSIGGNNIWDCIVSSFVIFLITFFLVVPVVFLCNNNDGSDISDLSEKILGKFGKLFSTFYAFYFLLICAHTLITFKVFIENVINPPISFLVLSTSIIVFACYASSKGIESIARASSIILFFISFLLIFIAFSLFKVTDFTNFKSFFYDGFDSFNKGFLFLLSRMSCIPAMGFLIPMVNGNVKKGIIFWNFMVFILMSVFIFLVVGVLGDLSTVKLFPVYTATSAAKISKFENLDSLYLGLWAAGIFLKISMFLNLSSECLRKTFGRKNNKIIVSILGIILIFVNMFSKISNFLVGIFNTKIILVFTISTAFVIPLILLLMRKIRQEAKV